MSEESRDGLIRQLGELMSELSETCYYAGWLMGTEYLVPELCHRAVASGLPQRWGHGTVEPERASKLIAIAAKLGHWANVDQTGTGFVPYDPFPLPPEYVATLDREDAHATPQDSRAAKDPEKDPGQS